MKQEIKLHKLKCDHCGEVIESGIVNVVNHSYNCKAKKKEPIDGFVIISTPLPSYTAVLIEDT